MRCVDSESPASFASLAETTRKRARQGGVRSRTLLQTLGNHFYCKQAHHMSEPASAERRLVWAALAASLLLHAWTFKSAPCQALHASELHPAAPGRAGRRLQVWARYRRVAVAALPPAQGVQYCVAWCPLLPACQPAPGGELALATGLPR